MIWLATGLIIGIVLGLNITYTIPLEYIKYTAVVIISILDSILGAIKSETKEVKDEYNQTIFISGILTNTILALIITMLGEKLGLDLYLAVTVVFIYRIFVNLGSIRRAIIKKILKN
jgi:small basic protein